MTENEAKEFIEKAKEQSKNVLAELLLLTPKVFAVKKENLGEYYSNLENCKKEIEACNVAVKALEENQRWHISEVNPNIKNVFANLSTQICHNCDHKDEYIEELEAEIEQYRAIGTVEECRTAIEKQKKGLSVDEAKTITAKAICIGCGYLIGSECSYKGGNCMTSKPMLESVLKSFDDWNRRANDEKTD